MNITVLQHKTYEWHRKRGSLGGVDPLQQGTGIGELINGMVFKLKNQMNIHTFPVCFEVILPSDDFSMYNLVMTASV
jgi:hypothetical protein